MLYACSVLLLLTNSNNRILRTEPYKFEIHIMFFSVEENGLIKFCLSRVNDEKFSKLRCFFFMEYNRDIFKSRSSS